MNLVNNIEQKYKINFSSFKTILLVALFIRLIAAIFSQGYGWHDDHFLVIEASGSWVDGADYNDWLPWTKGKDAVPQGHSFTYVGLNYIFFYCCKFLGFSDPKTLMLLNRLAHALFSMLIVYFGLKITEKISNRKNAITVGWLLALLSAMPMLSVRNLVEFTSIPFLMWGIWLMVKNDKKINLLYAGLLVGLAVSFRYQITIFGIGIGLYYLIHKEFYKVFLFGCGGVITFLITQGLVDYLIWGKPFTEFIAYSTYNMKEGTKYLPNSNYFMYFFVLMGVLLVPFGLLIGIGFFRSAKKHFILFLPTLLFILFHTFYPNRQERFVLSVLPFFIILGVIGYQELRQKPFWDKLWSFSYAFFWILNTVLLVFLTFNYSKESRVEAMYSLYSDDIKKERILMECTGDTEPSMMPRFYSSSWKSVTIERIDTTQTLLVNEGNNYDYIFFFGEERLNERIKEYKTLYPRMKLYKKCNPSLLDRIIRKLNPRNTNQYIEVWKTYDPTADKW